MQYESYSIKVAVSWTLELEHKNCIAIVACKPKISGILKTTLLMENWRSSYLLIEDWKNYIEKQNSFGLTITNDSSFLNQEDSTCNIHLKNSELTCVQ